jgi:hypothetical protein
MNDATPNGPSDADPDWDDRGDVAWNEFDWEVYLRQQDDVVHRYLAFYESLEDSSDRIDETAHLMGWDASDWSAEGVEIEDEAEPAEEDTVGDSEPYTLHKNPVFIANRAICLSLRRRWEQIADDPAAVPQSLAVRLQVSLFRAEEQALHAISSLDFGDYAMAVSQFKRALGELNSALALTSAAPEDHSRRLADFKAFALPRLFDLREIWLRVMNECRHEVGRHSEENPE